MNDALPLPMLIGPTLVEGPHKGHPLARFIDPVDGREWGVTVEPFTDPASGLNTPALIVWRRWREGDDPAERSHTLGRTQTGADVQVPKYPSGWEPWGTLQLSDMPARCALLRRVIALKHRKGGYEFGDPEYLAICGALGLNPDPDPLFGGRPPSLAC